MPGHQGAVLSEAAAVPAHRLVHRFDLALCRIASSLGARLERGAGLHDCDLGHSTDQKSVLSVSPVRAAGRARRERRPSSRTESECIDTQGRTITRSQAPSSVTVKRARPAPGRPPGLDPADPARGRSPSAPHALELPQPHTPHESRLACRPLATRPSDGRRRERRRLNDRPADRSPPSRSGCPRRPSPTWSHRSRSG